MIFTCNVTRTVTFTTDEFNAHFHSHPEDTQESAAEIEAQLRHDNGQFMHLMGDVFGWDNTDDSFTVTKEQQR